jgi:signal transduction histidine kinase
LARSEAQRSRVSLQTQLAKEVPLILGDRIQLQQVILNLIINAIEAMSGVGEGPRELQVGSGKDNSQGVLVTRPRFGPGAILRTLRETGGIVGGRHGAALRLGLKRTTLLSKMERLGISRKYTLSIEKDEPKELAR